MKHFAEAARLLAPGWTVGDALTVRTQSGGIRVLLSLCKEISSVELMSSRCGPGDMVDQLSLRDFNLCTAKERELLDSIAGSGAQAVMQDITSSLGAPREHLAQVLAAAARRLRADDELERLRKSRQAGPR